MDYEAKARNVDREFNSAEYVRNAPPGPVLTLLRSMPPTTGLVVGHEGSSRSFEQLVSDCAEKRSISPERFGCCYGQDQARGMIANFINRAFGLVSLRCMARSDTWLSQLPRARSSTLLVTRPRPVCGYAGGEARGHARESTGDWRPGSGRVHLPSVKAWVARS